MSTAETEPIITESIEAASIFDRVTQLGHRVVDAFSHFGENLPVPGKFSAGLAAVAMGVNAGVALLEASPAGATVSKATLARYCRNASLDLQTDILTVPATNDLRFFSNEVALDSILPTFGIRGASCSSMGHRVVKTWHEKEMLNRKGFVRDTKVITLTGNRDFSTPVGPTVNDVGTPVSQFPTYEGCLPDGQAPLYRDVSVREWISRWRTGKQTWQKSYYLRTVSPDLNAPIGNCAPNTSDTPRLDVSSSTPIRVFKP